MHSIIKKDFPNSSLNSQPLILIIDDDSDNLLLASCIIESLGMNYVVADEAEKCLDLVSKNLPDLVLLDIVMPKINGLEIARLIKQDRKIAHIPLIAVTGLTKQEDRKKLIKAGFDGYLCKPYLIEDLEFKIYSHLGCCPMLSNS